MTQYAPENRSSPESSASYISRLTFGWLGPLIKQGYKKKLCFDDLWTLTPDREVEYQSERFNHYAHNKQSIPLWKCVLGYFRYRLLRTAVLIVLYDLLVLSNFFLLSWILTIFQTEDPDLVIGSILVIFLGLGTISSVLVEKHYYGYGSDMDIDVKSILSVKIYEKTLRLNNMTKGDVMTMMSVDTMKVAECFENFHAVWEAPCMLILVVALTASVLGWSAIIGGAVLVVAIPIYYFMCSFWYNQQDLLMTLQDKRVKSLTQALEGILTIKLFHWGEFAKNIIDKIRAKELISVRYYNILFTVCMTMILCICTIISAISLGCFVLFGNVLTPEIIFPVLYLYQAATWPLIDFPYILSALIQAYSSCKRIETFLHLAEIPHSYQVPGDQIQVEMIDCTFTYPAPVELPSDDSETSETEEASNSTDSFLKDETGTDLQSVVLSNINFKSCGSELIAIVGSVGVGKSSFLRALLGELDKMDGQVHLSGSIAYCPQQTWIRNMTLQDNILMGSTFDQCFYDSVLDSCALKPDLAILPRGDQTEIGEKGTNLSGGQKQRVSLARAVYSNKDIYLLDDPLSAVDAHVGNHLFTHCICGLLQSKLRILVTHQLQVLPQCDRIIVLENGMIAHQGTFQELSEKGVNFHTVTAAEESEQPDLEQADQKCSVPDLSKKTHQTVPVEPSENLTGDLTSEEEHAEGAVNTSVYLKYFLSFGKPLLLTALLFCVCTEVFYELYTVWLAYWPSDDVTILSQNYLGEWRNLVVYFVLTAFYVASVAMRNTCWFQGAYKASVKLHQGLLDSIFAAGMDFFYQTPKGRIINRFSKDMTVIDQELPDMISDFLLTFFQLVAEFFIMSIACPPFIILLIVIIIAYYWLQRFYRPVNRDLTRLRTIHSSPLYEHYSETIDGLESIRAYEMQNAQKNDNFARVNRNSMTLYLQLAISRWMGVRVGFLGAVVVLSVAGMGLLLEYFDMSSPLIYMSLYYSTTCTGALNWGIRSFTTMEAHMAHVERILHYTNNVAPELTCPACVDGIIPPDWPNKGVITFENVCARYSETKPMVLHNINFSIQSAEKIGVVGRTGAGKSTLTLVLTRILPLSSGRIFIDGVDIFSLSLGKLRTSLGIVPQDPVLLAGTIRSNLDPHGRFSDDQIWEVLQRVCLFDFVQNRTGRLRSEIAEGGNNISVGQRQLLCFARAILGGAKIILLDEATASVDPETDSIIQTTIRKAFADRVVITVAHRLSTIMDYDRILVLDKGEVSQFDSPSALLKQPGIFQSLVNEAIASGSVSSSMVSDL